MTEASPRRRIGRRILRWFLAIAPLVLVAWAIQARWDDVGGARLPAGWSLVVAVVANVVGNLILVSAWRWQVTRTSDVTVLFRDALVVWSTSQLSRLVFPGAPIGARAVLGRSYGVRGAVGAWTTLLEIVWMLSIGPFVVLVTLPAWGSHAEGWQWLGWAAVVPGVLVLWVVARPRRALRWTADVLRRVPVAKRLVPDAVEDVAVDLSVRETASLAGLYLLNYVTRMVAFVALVAGVTSLTSSLLATALGAIALGRFVGTIALFAPGGIGPREGVTALVLGPLLGAGALVLVAVSRLTEVVAEAVVYVGGRLAAAKRRPRNPGGGPAPTIPQTVADAAERGVEHE